MPAQYSSSLHSMNCSSLAKRTNGQRPKGVKPELEINEVYKSTT